MAKPTKDSLTGQVFKEDGIDSTTEYCTNMQRKIMNKFVKGITMLVPVLLVGTIDVALAATKLDLVEEQTLVQRIDNGDGVESPGDQEIFKSVLKDSTGTVVGRKETTCLLDQPTPNGDFVVDCNEIIFLGQDKNNALIASGKINLTGKFFELKPQKIDIIGGTGIYAGAKGKETITRLRPEPGLYSNELVFNF